MLIPLKLLKVVVVPIFHEELLVHCDIPFCNNTHRVVLFKVSIVPCPRIYGKLNVCCSWVFFRFCLVPTWEVSWIVDVTHRTEWSGANVSVVFSAFRIGELLP